MLPVSKGACVTMIPSDLSAHQFDLNHFDRLQLQSPLWVQKNMGALCTGRTTNTTRPATFPNRLPPQQMLEHPAEALDLGHKKGSANVKL